MNLTVLAILALWVISVLSVYAMFTRDLSNARTRLVGRSKTIETSYGTLEYAAVGSGAPVLAIHGAGGGFDQAIDMTGALAERGYRLIAPSRFGYLGSAMPAGLTTAMQADAYVELLDRLGIDAAFVVAISAGTWSATQLAIRHAKRCRALVLLVPADYLPTNTRNRGGAFARIMFNSDFVAWVGVKLTPVILDVMSRTMLGTDPAVVRAASFDERARMHTILDRLLPMSARSSGMQFDIKTAATRESYPLGKIGCPVLAISAEDDLFNTAARARYIAANVCDGRAVIHPTGGHALIGRYADVMRGVLAFLSAGEGGSEQAAPSNP